MVESRQFGSETKASEVLHQVVQRDDNFIRFVTAAFAASLFLVSALSVSSYFILHFTFGEHATTDGVDSVTERQRALSQRVALLSLSYVDAHTPSVRDRFRKELLRVLQDLEKNHVWLLGKNSAGESSIQSPAIRSVYFEEPHNVDAKLQAFIAHAEAIVESGDGAVTLEDPHLIELTRLSTELLQGYEQLVQLSRIQSAAGIRWVTTLLLVLLALTLLVLLLSVVLIFRPMVARIRQELRIRALAEARLASSEERYRVVTENVADAIIAVDRQARILFANSGTERIFGYDPREVHVQTITTLFYTEVDPLEFLRSLQKRSDTAEPLELKGKRKDDSLVDVAVTVGTSQQFNEPWIVVTARDISLRKEAERQAEAYRHQIVKFNQELLRSNRDLEEFASIISHDLKAPLHQIGAYGELLENRHGADLPSEALEFLGLMRGGVARAKKLILDLLDVCRVSTAVTPWEEVSLADIFKDVERDSRQKVEEAEAIVSTSGLDKTIEADPSQMYQLLQNLFQNALKFRCSDRQCRVEISAEECEVNGAAGVRIVVSDNGRGFPKESESLLFRMMYRAEGVGKIEGTGVGLSICKKIVERHHGSIAAFSEEGSGATFQIDLPRSQEKVDVGAGSVTKST